jgi:DNA replication protein DnaT
MRRSWIKIETNTPNKPEVCIIASQLRMDEDAVMGKLVRLWAWAELNVSSDNDTSVTLEFLDKLVAKKGFSAALLKAGWLIEKEGRLEFPNFSRHNGREAKSRAQTAQRVSRHRAQKANAVAPKSIDDVPEVTSFADIEPTPEPTSEMLKEDKSVHESPPKMQAPEPEISIAEATSLIEQTLTVQETTAPGKRRSIQQAKKDEDQPLLF